jgi:cytochrome c
MVHRYLTLAILSASAAVWSHGALADGDAAKGQKIFQRCAVCHGIGDATKPVGPNLNNVIGRTAGTLEGYERYSADMKAAGAGGLVWTEEKIAEYIEAPRKMVPRGTMAFPGLRAEQDRADVVAYIAQFSEASPAGEADGEGDGDSQD